MIPLARRTYVVLLVLWIAAWGCDGTMPPQSPGRVRVPGPAYPDPAPSRKTTSERIALANLAASIESSRRGFAASPDFAAASALIEALMLRADLYGSFDDWDEALRVSGGFLDAHPSSPAALLLRARVLHTLHEFDSALALITRATQQESGRDDVGRVADLAAQSNHLEASILLAQGGALDEVVARRRAMAVAHPTYQNLTSLGLALAKLERFQEADAAFRWALERYRDVSPFPFAWVAFQRGVMWSEQAGRPDLGRPLYEEALRYLPGYVLPNVHLAELDVSDGDIAGAIHRLERIGETQNPEPLALLAAIEPSVDRARQYAEQASAAYARLTKRFPAAFAHHDSTSSLP